MNPLSTALAVILGLGSVAGGVLVFRVSSMARATFALLASFLFGAGEVLLLGLTYLGLVIVLMMVIEMVIMAVFMVMYMMNPAGLMPMTMVHNRRGSLAIGAGSFVVLGGGALLIPWPRRPAVGAADATLSLGQALMGPHMLTMIVLAMVLFAAIVGTVLLAGHRGRYAAAGPGRHGTGEPGSADR